MRRPWRWRSRSTCHPKPIEDRIPEDAKITQRVQDKMQAYKKKAQSFVKENSYLEGQATDHRDLWGTLSTTSNGNFSVGCAAGRKRR